MEQFPVKIDLSGVDHQLIKKLTPKESTELFFICSESITNALKHGKATNIWVNIADHSLQIYDDGVGFEEAKHLSGIGTRIMNYRANVIGWSFGMRRYCKSHGTVVSCHRFKEPKHLRDLHKQQADLP
ncbi:MAG: hypothetical protein HRU09_16960 [Oligoflexales bacterium]|nr:hypothetical protein [Oligoflexales bacterium]